MSEIELRKVILNSIKFLGLPIDFSLDIRGHSSCYYGRYLTKESRIIVYSLDSEGSLLPVKHLVKVVIHEAIHHLQWKHDPTFVRIKGIMHNSEFKRLEEFYLKKYERRYLN